MLEQVRELGPAATPAAARELLAHLGDGRAKLYLIWCALGLRRADEALFARGDYLPLKVSGSHAAHVCAFARRHAGRLLIAVVPRLYWRLLSGNAREPIGREIWGDTEVEMPRDCQAIQLSGALVAGQVEVHARGERRVFDVAEALASFPIALLHTEMPS